MAPNFSPEFGTMMFRVVMVFGCGVTVGVAVLGWYLGRLFPPLRHVAPLALAGLAWWRFDRLLAPDGRPFVVIWVIAGALVSVGTLVRDRDRGRRSRDSADPPPPVAEPR